MITTWVGSAPMQQLRPGLWTWTAPHPAWTEDEGGPDGWNRVVLLTHGDPVLADGREAVRAALDT